MKSAFLLILFLLFLGCDGKIYKNIYDKSKIGQSIASIEIIANNEESFNLSKSVIEQRGFIVSKSRYKLRAELRDYTKTCTNPLSKTSSEYSYDGLVGVEFFYDKSKIYSSHKEFKGGVEERLFATLIDNMIDDLKIKPARD